MATRPTLVLISSLAVAAIPSACQGQSVYTDITTPVDVQLGVFVSMLGDLDGDGCSEVGANTFGTSHIYSGRTGVMLAAYPNHNLVKRAGDLNGDGTQDFLLRPPSGGTLELYLGGAGASWPLAHTFTISTVTWSPIVALGDVDGDGFDDVGVASSNTCYVFSGQTKAQIFSSPGRDMCAVGDVTGDGVNDIATQSSSSTTLHSLVGPAVSFGSIQKVWNLFAGPSGCAGVGDVDGDGVPDVAVGESYASPGLNRAGEVFVYSGSTGAMLQRYPGATAGARFGRGIVRIGDLNGDGSDEVLIGTTAFRAVVFDLRAGAELASIDGLGHAFVTLDAGLDVTGDGVPDGLIGCPQPATSSPGFVRVFSGADLTLQADSLQLSAAGGGAVQFSVDLGAAHAGASYFVLGSLVEPVPGLTIGSVTIPLVEDFYFDYLLYNPNTLINNSFGTLDPSGRANATLSVAPGFVPAALAGAVFRHACVAVSGATPLDVTNYLPLAIL